MLSVLEQTTSFVMTACEDFSTKHAVSTAQISLALSLCNKMMSSTRRGYCSGGVFHSQHTFSSELYDIQLDNFLWPCTVIESFYFEPCLFFKLWDLSLKSTETIRVISRDMASRPRMQRVPFVRVLSSQLFLQFDIAGSTMAPWMLADKTGLRSVFELADQDGDKLLRGDESSQLLRNSDASNASTDWKRILEHPCCKVDPYYPNYFGPLPTMFKTSHRSRNAHTLLSWCAALAEPLSSEPSTLWLACVNGSITMVGTMVYHDHNIIRHVRKLCSQLLLPPASSQLYFEACLRRAESVQAFIDRTGDVIDYIW